MERGYKSGLLVAEAKVKGFEKSWSILIDSGASCNYARCRSLEGSQRYAEALTAHEGDSITVRLATGSRVTVPKVSLNSGIKKRFDVKVACSSRIFQWWTVRDSCQSSLSRNWILSSF